MQRRQKLLSSHSLRALCVALGLFSVGLPGTVRAVEVIFVDELDGRLKQLVRAAFDDAPSSSILADPNTQDRVDAVLAVLGAEGHYGAQVTVETEEPLVLRVQAGRSFLLSAPRVEVDAPAGLETVIKALPQLADRPARTADILSAEAVGLTALRAAGYADASLGERRVIVDHATRRVTPTYRYTSGDLVRLSAIRVEGARRTPASYLDRLPGWTEGDTFSPEALRTLEERIRFTRAYQDVSLRLVSTEPASELGVRDVEITVTEESRRSLGYGLSWSTLDGFGVDVTYDRRHLLRQADTLTLRGLVATREQSVSADWFLPHALRAERNIRLSARIANEDNEAFERQIGTAAIYLDRPAGRKATTTLGAAIDLTRTALPTPRIVGARQRFAVASDVRGILGYAIDRSDSALNPTRGWRADAQVEPAVLYRVEPSPYGKIAAGGSVYVPAGFAKDGVLAARLKGGVLIGGGGLPVDRRFFAGGGGSVRGYDYKAIGPRDLSGNPLGGRVLLEGAAEARWTLFGAVGAAVFIDGASVGETSSDVLDTFRFGAGFGVRYDLGFAPIRLDIATPLERRDGEAPVQIYVSVGQSF